MYLSRTRTSVLPPIGGAPSSILTAPSVSQPPFPSRNGWIDRFFRRTDDPLAVYQQDKTTPFPLRSRSFAPRTAPASQDVQMTDAPDLIPTRFERASQYYADNLAPMVNATATVAAKGLTHGVKRVAEDIVYPITVAAFTAYNEIKHTDEDGLVVKRFKRLPFGDNNRTSLAEDINTLPVSELRRLPASHFRWTDDPLMHLGHGNHVRLRSWLKNLAFNIRHGLFTTFEDIDYLLIPRALPASVTERIQRAKVPSYISVFLHNYHIRNQKKDNSKTWIENFTVTGFSLLRMIDCLVSYHVQIYDDGGRVPVYRACHCKPTGPIKFPYVTTDLCQERKLLRDCMCLLVFMLETRSSFNQSFPAAAFAGYLADLDAIRADQPPPSYVDWPGKFELLIPGAWPEHDMEERLFDTIKFADYTIDSLWDTKHPSPKKKVTAADQRTPIRRAMRKNVLIKNRMGQMQPRKGALKKVETDYKAIEKRCELETIDNAEKRLDIDMLNAHVVREGRVNFIDGPVAFYMPSANTPFRQPVPHSRKYKELRKISEQPAVRFTDDTDDEDDEGEAAQVSSSAQDDADAKARSSKLIDDLLDSVPTPPRHKAGPNIPVKLPSEIKTADELLADDGPLGRPLYLKISQDKLDEMEMQLQLIEDFEFQAEQEQALKDREAEEERKRVADELLKAELKSLREENHRKFQTGQLRMPNKDMIPDLPEEWKARAVATLGAPSNRELAKLPEGTALTRNDFEKVVPDKVWLNDEIVNGTLSHLTNYINQSAGIKDLRAHTPKCQMFNSFVFKSMIERNSFPTDRALRRAGIRQEDFFDIETILMPICNLNHWTLAVIRPKHRQFAHLDSFLPNGQEEMKPRILNFLQHVLGDAFHQDEWIDMSLESGLQSPSQPNTYDCGVHAITNGICMGLAIDPMSAYDTKKIKMQRLHIASVLLNGGFTKDFTLDWI